MRKLLYLLVFFPGFLLAQEGPIYQHEQPEIQREFQEVYSKVQKAEKLALTTSTVSEFPSGTKVVMFQSVCPSSWTQVTTQNDKVLRIVSGTGGGSGGSHATSTSISLAHSHTINNHTHSTPNHQHDVDYDLINNWDPDTNAPTGSADSAGALVYQLVAGTGFERHLRNRTRTDGSGTSGNPSDTGTDSQLSDVSLAYIDVIVCEKD